MNTSRFYETRLTLRRRAIEILDAIVFKIIILAEWITLRK